MKNNTEICPTCGANSIKPKYVVLPYNLYIGLGSFKEDGSKTGTFIEPTDPTYSRILAKMYEVDSNHISNIELITFPEASTDWGIIDYVFFFTSPDAIDAVKYLKLISQKRILRHDTAHFSKNAILLIIDTSN